MDLRELKAISKKLLAHAVKPKYLCGKKQYLVLLQRLSKNRRPRLKRALHLS